MLTIRRGQLRCEEVEIISVMRRREEGEEQNEEEEDVEERPGSPQFSLDRFAEFLFPGESVL